MLENAAWLDANWMYLSLVLGVITFLYLLKNQEVMIHKRGAQYWYGLLICAIYSTHQFEEHGYDIYGRHYMFVPTFNANLLSQFDIAMTPRQCTYINIIAIWVSIPVCAYFSNAENKYIPVAVSWGVAIVNGAFGHLMPLLQGSYVPGAAQSALMVPFGLWVLFNVHGRFSLLHKFVLPFVGGFVFHAVGLLYPVLYFSQSPEWIVPAFVAFGGIVIPVAMGKLCHRPEIPQ